MVRVLPDVAGVHRAFDYTVPEGMTLSVGDRVRVSLHGRRVGGWVVEDQVVAVVGRALQPVRKSSGRGPTPELVALARWAAWRWAGPVATFLRTASPDHVVTALPEPPLRSDPPGPGDGQPDALVAEVAQRAGERPGEAVLARLPPDAALLPVVDRLVRLLLAAPNGGQSPGSVLVLLPELAAAERLAASLGRRGLPSAFGARRWEQAAAGWPVVVGTRAAAWSPTARLAGAVVLDAHHEAYREERAPTWDAVEVVAERCRRHQVPCVAVTPTPTVAMAARWPTVAPPRLVERDGWPLLQAIDMRQADPRTGLLSEPLVAACRRVLDRASSSGPEVVCVLNRRGRARLLACAACGELVRCHRCGGPSELLEEELSCRRCEARRPALCASCGSTRLRRLRMGVKGVAEELSALLRQPVGEVVGEAEGVPDTAVVVGTEAVLHRVRRSSLVAFLDFDQHLLAPSFTAAEVALALLGRAGRMVGGRARCTSSQRARVLVQTRVPDHEVVLAAQRGDPGPLLEAERAVREALQLPPAAALAVVSGPQAAEFVAGIEARAPSTLVVGQSDPDRFVLRAPDHDQLCDALAATDRPRGRLRVEVDPGTI